MTGEGGRREGGGTATLRFLPKAVQQLKILPGADTNLIFNTLGWTRYLTLIALKRTNEGKTRPRMDKNVEMRR